MFAFSATDYVDLLGSMVIDRSRLPHRGFEEFAKMKLFCMFANHYNVLLLFTILMISVMNENMHNMLRANVLGFRIVNFWNSLPEDVVSAELVSRTDLTIIVNTCVIVQTVRILSSEIS